MVSETPTTCHQSSAYEDMWFQKHPPPATPDDVFVIFALFVFRAAIISGTMMSWMTSPEKRVCWRNWSVAKWVPCSCTAWCSEIGPLTSLDAPLLHASYDVREPISRTRICTVIAESFVRDLIDFKRLVSHSISPKFSGKIPYVLS